MHNTSHVWEILVMLCAAVKRMGSDFVLGYIQAMDGEKDPRNMVIVFNTVYRIVLHLPFGECRRKENGFKSAL